MAPEKASPNAWITFALCEVGRTITATIATLTIAPKTLKMLSRFTLILSLSSGTFYEAVRAGIHGNLDFD